MTKSDALLAALYILFLISCFVAFIIIDAYSLAVLIPFVVGCSMMGARHINFASGMCLVLATITATLNAPSITTALLCVVALLQLQEMYVNNKLN